MYTQCSHCRTAFEIGAEDLRRAHGRVRCGQCGTVFDAIETLTPEPPPGESSPPRFDDDTPFEVVLASLGHGSAAPGADETQSADDDDAGRAGAPDDAAGEDADLDDEEEWRALLAELDLDESVLSGAIDGPRPMAEEDEAEPAPDAASAPDTEPVLDPAPAPDAEPAPDPDNVPASYFYADSRSDSEIADESAAAVETRRPAELEDGEGKLETGYEDQDEDEDEDGYEYVYVYEYEDEEEDEVDDEVEADDAHDDGLPGEDESSRAADEGEDQEEADDEEDAAPAPAEKEIAALTTGESRTDLDLSPGAGEERREPQSDQPVTTEEELLEPKLPPRPAPARTALWSALAVLLVLLLGAQVIHGRRAELVTHPGIGPGLERLYEAVGMPVQPRWDIGALCVESSSGDAAASALEITTVIRHRGERPQPYPLLRVAVTDRWQSTIGRVTLTPAQYLPDGPPDDEMSLPGQRIQARARLPDPGREAAGYELHVCYRDGDGGLRCSGACP